MAPAMLARITFAVSILLMLLAVGVPLSGQAKAPWFGTWRLNTAKSTANPDSRFKRVTLRIEPWEDGLKVTYDMVGTRGGTTHMEWTGKFDGKDDAVQGVDYVLTNAYRYLNDHSYEITVKVDGAVAATATVTISADGKILTTATKEKDAQGQDVNMTTVYEKQ